MQTGDAVQECCPVWWPHWPFLMIAPSFANLLTQKRMLVPMSISGADGHCGAAHAAVVALREDPEMWHRVCGPLWMHPYCHPPRGDTSGHGTASAPGAPPGCRVPSFHQHCLPEGCLRRPAHLPVTNPKPPTHTGFLSQFCFSLLSPLPRALGPLSHTPTPLPFTASEWQHGVSWL